MRSGPKSVEGLSRSQFNETLAKRFRSKCGAPDARGCIPWLGSKTHRGYGLIQVGNRGSVKTSAHRIAWVLVHGDLPPDLCVLHRCDNPSCVNADHLFIGSVQQNVQDMVAKNRHPWRNGTPWQKLNSTDGERIRDLRRAGCIQQQVADWLGVSRPLISLIESRRVQHSVLATVSC